MLGVIGVMDIDQGIVAIAKYEFSWSVGSGCSNRHDHLGVDLPCSRHRVVAVGDRDLLGERAGVDRLGRRRGRGDDRQLRVPPHYLICSIMIIVVCIVVIWALTVHGRDITYSAVVRSARTNRGDVMTNESRPNSSPPGWYQDRPGRARAHTGTGRAGRRCPTARARSSTSRSTRPSPGRAAARHASPASDPADPAGRWLVVERVGWSDHRAGGGFAARARSVRRHRRRRPRRSETGRWHRSAGDAPAGTDDPPTSDPVLSSDRSMMSVVLIHGAETELWGPHEIAARWIPPCRTASGASGRRSIPPTSRSLLRATCSGDDPEAVESGHVRPPERESRMRSSRRLATTHSICSLELAGRETYERTVHMFTSMAVDPSLADRVRQRLVDLLDGTRILVRTHSAPSLLTRRWPLTPRSLSERCSHSARRSGCRCSRRTGSGLAAPIDG